MGKAARRARRAERDVPAPTPRLVLPPAPAPTVEAPAPAPPIRFGGADWKARLEFAGRFRRQQLAAEVDVVRQARAGGASWAEIGQALGMTRQAAHERFAARCG